MLRKVTSKIILHILISYVEKQNERLGKDRRNYFDMIELTLDKFLSTILAKIPADQKVSVDSGEFYGL